jgi:hypothetical protein
MASESEKPASMAAEAVLSAFQMHLRMEALLAHNVIIKMEDIMQATGKLIISSGCGGCRHVCWLAPVDWLHGL